MRVVVKGMVMGDGSKRRSAAQLREGRMKELAAAGGDGMGSEGDPMDGMDGQKKGKGVERAGVSKTK